MKTSARGVVCLVLFVCCIFSAPFAVAEELVAWLPYAFCQNLQFPGDTGFVPSEIPPFGGRGNSYYLRRPLCTNEANQVWPESRVFIGSGAASWYSSTDYLYTWELVLQNTGSAAITLQIRMYSGGTQVNEQSKWLTGDGQPTDDFLINQNNPAWSSTQDCFTVTLSTYQTVRLPAVGGTTAFFTSPATGRGTGSQVIRVSQASGTAFHARIEGNSAGRYRYVGPTDGVPNQPSDFLSPRIPQYRYAYNAVFESEYDSSLPTHTITVPSYEELYDPTAGVVNRSTAVKVINPTDSDQRLTVVVREGTTVIAIDPCIVLGPYEGVLISPSQYAATSTDAMKGSMTITGTCPIGVGFIFRFVPSVQYSWEDKPFYNPTMTTESLFVD